MHTVFVLDRLNAVCEDAKKEGRLGKTGLSSETECNVRSRASRLLVLLFSKVLCILEDDCIIPFPDLSTICIGWILGAALSLHTYDSGRDAKKSACTALDAIELKGMSQVRVHDFHITMFGNVRDACAMLPNS